MLWRLFPRLFQEPLTFLLLLPVVLATLGLALLVAITVHEFSHAYMADRLGDGTARRLGRVTLNPIRHLDKLGTVMLFLVGFGWGKPVPVNTFALRGGRRGMAQVALSGAVANIITAAIFALPIRLGIVAWHDPFNFLSLPQISFEPLIGSIFALIIFYNIILAVFNLIPLPPLDGFNVAVGILPRDLAASYARIERYGAGLLLLLIAADYFTNVPILWGIMSPAINLISLILLQGRLV
jgi:Zn-dependent protease